MEKYTEYVEVDGFKVNCIDKINQKDHEFKFFFYDVIDGKAKLKF